MKYEKPPLTFTEQVDLLESRGLLIEDRERAESYLSQISYYRLSAYALPFQQVKDVYNEATTFENLLALYVFDRGLRLLIFDAIERIEVAIRTQIIHRLSHKYGSHWQDEASLFIGPYINPFGKEVNIFDDSQKIIQDKCSEKHPEVFVSHYRTKYSSPANPPSWMSIELFTIGQLSRLYSALKVNEDKQLIASQFGLHYTFFTNWMHTLTYVRNICAHHSRLWNRDLAITPFILLKPRQPWLKTDFTGNNHRCFYFLCVLKYLLFKANPNGHFKEKLMSLFELHPNVPIQFLGIPSINGKIIDWKNEPLWK